jgi:hypothetical protein
MEIGFILLHSYILQFASGEILILCDRASEEVAPLLSVPCLHFYPDSGRSRFLRNVSDNQSDYKSSYLIRHYVILLVNTFRISNFILHFSLILNLKGLIIIIIKRIIFGTNGGEEERV